MDNGKTMPEGLSWGTNRSCGCEYDVLIMDRREDHRRPRSHITGQDVHIETASVDDEAVFEVAH
jgi:hypothetical protein